MANTNIRRGPVAGGLPIEFRNRPDAVGFAVDGLTGDVYVGNAASGRTYGIGMSSAALKVLAATITYTSNATPAVITGFSWTVAAGGTYVFDMNLWTTMTTTGGLTVAFKLTTATLTSIRYGTYAATASDNTTAVSTTGTTTTDLTEPFDSKTAAYTLVNVKGSMVVNAGGTFSWYAAQETSASGGDVSAILIGSYAKLYRAL